MYIYKNQISKIISYYTISFKTAKDHNYSQKLISSQMMGNVYNPSTHFAKAGRTQGLLQFPLPLSQHTISLLQLRLPPSLHPPYTCLLPSQHTRILGTIHFLLSFFVFFNNQTTDHFDENSSLRTDGFSLLSCILYTLHIFI